MGGIGDDGDGLPDSLGSLDRLQLGVLAEELPQGLSGLGKCGAILPVKVQEAV